MTARASNTHKYKPYIKILVWLTGISVVFFLMLRVDEKKPKEGGLRSMATSINKHVPRALDNLVRLDYVHVLDDSSIQYYHTIKTLERSQINIDSFTKQIESKLMTDEAPDIQYCRKYNVRIEWRYVDRNKEEVCIVRAGPGGFPAIRKTSGFQEGKVNHQ